MTFWSFIIRIQHSIIPNGIDNYSLLDFFPTTYSEFLQINSSVVRFPWPKLSVKNPSQDATDCAIADLVPLSLSFGKAFKDVCRCI